MSTKTVEEKIEQYRAYGLTDQEIQALLTPLSQHSPEMRKLAYMANDKLTQAIEKENEEFVKLNPQWWMTVMERIKQEQKEGNLETEKEEYQMAKPLCDCVEEPFISSKETPKQQESFN